MSSRNLPTVNYLTPEQILLIHNEMIKRFGGSHGLRDLDLLESAAARPQASFDGIDLYKTVFEKAASLMHSLLKNHPFIDGNKRTAFSCTGVFLKRNGYVLINMHEQTLQFCLDVENNSLQLEDIAAWLQKHSKKKK